MREFSRKFNCASAGALLLSLSVPGVAAAANGMNMIGYGTRAVAMGGAGVATTDDGGAMMLNPAGLASIAGRRAELGSTLVFPSAKHSDRLGNSIEDSLSRMPSPYATYAQSHDGAWGRWAWGVGLFLQGGLGVEYDSLTTPFAARKAAGLLPDPGGTVPAADRLKSQFAHFKLTPTLAWNVTENFSVGVGLQLSYARASLAMFPDTSVNAGPLRFSGITASGMDRWGAGFSVGVQYRIRNWSLGASYASRTALGLQGGRAIANMSAMGLGRVGYAARLDGFAWPQQVSGGIGYRWSPRLLFAVDYTWINWSATHDRFTVVLTGPDRAGAPATLTMPLALRWRDQHVAKIGMEWQATDDLALRLGFNYARRPMRDADFRTQLPAIAETHVTAGLGYRLGGWDLAAALEFVPRTSVTNDSADQSVNLLGPGSRTSLRQFSLGLSLGRRF